MKIFAFGLLGCGALVACQAGNDHGTVGISLARSASTAVPAATSSEAGLTLSDGTHELRLERAEVVLREIELELVEGTELCTDDDGGDCDEDFASPALRVELPLDGSVERQLELEVPAGTYDEIELELHEVGDDAEDQAFIAQNPDFVGLSVRVSGSFDGVPFVYETDVSAEQELKLEAPLVVDGEQAINVTLSVDVASWFVDAAGALIDPATAGEDGVHEELVEENIVTSFEGFRDDDEDGEDDVGEDESEDESDDDGEDEDDADEVDDADESEADEDDGLEDEDESADDDTVSEDSEDGSTEDASGSDDVSSSSGSSDDQAL